MKRVVQALRKQWARAPYIVTSVVLGLIAGLVAVAFHKSIELIFVHTQEHLSEMSLEVFAGGSFLVIMLCSLISGWLLSHFAPDAAGSGIPQMKLAFWKDFGYVPLKTVLVKFVAGSLSVGGGLSLGREGPTVQLAGGLASWVSGWLGTPKQKRRSAAAAGAASGLAAAFNTPLAAITFVLEEIVGDLNSRFLGGVLLASVMGALVTHAFLGDHPAFIIGDIEKVTWVGYVLTPVVAVVAAIVGLQFQRQCLWLRGKCKKWIRMPPWLKPCVGGLVTWISAMVIFYAFKRLGVFSLGYVDLNDALHGHMLWQVALALLVAKFIATMFSYGTGGCGGIFAPTLFFGGMIGASLSGVFKEVMPVTDGDGTLLAVVGMCACLGAVVRAPITAILMIFEMTHEFLFIPPLMLATLVSQLIARVYLKNNFYEQALEQDGHNLSSMVPPRDLRQWQQRTVATSASYNVVVLEQLDHEYLERMFVKHPYNRFPVVMDGEVKGVLRRKDAETAFAEDRIPELLHPIWTTSRETFGELQNKFIEAAYDMALVGDENKRQLLGVISLHDLLRDQQTLLERSE
ncbi:MAG: chloride channel protein [Verrucomicrobiota bacterium]